MMQYRRNGTLSRYSWLNEGPESAPITKGDLQQIENYADRLFAKVGIDVEFTQHFLDRVNDERNKKQINMAELTRLFKQEFKKYGKKIAQLGPGAEAVMKDMRTDVNMPFVLQWDKNNQELDLVAKTIMRKKNFRTPDPEFAVEGVGIITKQNATKDAPLGSEFANVEKLGLGKGLPKELHKKATKNSDPNKLFNLGLTEDVDVSTQRGRLAYYLKQPEIAKGMAVHLGKLPKYYDGKDELADMVPDRNGVYALHPDAWESTFYSLTNKDLKKITRYQPAIVKIPANSVVGDMAIANQFYRTDDADEKQAYAKAYRDSIVPYGSDTSHIKMPELIMPQLVENKQLEQMLATTALQEVSMLNKFKQKMSPMIKPDLYARAAETLHSVLVRKSKEGNLRHSLPYYAMAIGRSFAGVDYRALARYYQDHYDLEAINELRYERKPKDDELIFGKGTRTKWKTDKKLPNLRVPTKATRTDRIRAMQAMPESEEELEEGWAQTLSNLVLGTALTIGGLGALTVKQALDSPDFSKQEKVEIFTAANLPASQLPKELQLPKPKPEIEYTPLTSTTNEKILARVAKQNGIKGIELAAFMAQMAHESEDFTDMVEDNPNIDKYAGRLAKALGNRNVNDAERYIGRGFIQLTGRWNYEWMQKSLGVDLTSSWSKAHQASEPKIAAKIAVEFWKQRVRPKVDDFADVAAVTKPINSRLHGLKHREARFSKMAYAMNEGTATLYHATYKPFLDSIMKNGLGGSGAQTQWEDSKPGYVYLAKDPDVAISHAEANEEVPDEYIDDIVLLIIDASKLDYAKLEDDPNVMDDDSTLAYNGVIPSTTFIVKIDELKIEKPDGKDTLGIMRAEMPQVASEHYPELFDYFKANGANFKMQTVSANSLKAIQGEFSDAGVIKSLQKYLVGGKTKKPIIASVDDYIIDGHHRWLAALNTDSEGQIDIIRVNKTGEDLLQLVIDFPKTTYKDIHN
jgi:predicted chitinase